MEKKICINNKKELYSYVGGTVLVALMIVVMLFGINVVKLQGKDDKLSSKMAQKYDLVKENEDATQSSNVRFDAYVLKDIDGDGKAEKLRGTCKKIGEQDTLYMELNVNGLGTLKNASISINGKNFYLSTALVESDVISKNYISSNTKDIELKEITEGTNALIQGTIKSGDYNYTNDIRKAIQDGNINNYSVKDNEITFTGTYIDENGNEQTIRKSVNLIVDWYGEVEASIQNKYQNYELDSTNNTVDFEIEVKEMKHQLMLSKLHVEGVIPQLNGYNPINVEVLTGNGKYDSSTRKFVVEKSNSLIDDGIVNLEISNHDYIKVSVTYPKEAFLNTNETKKLMLEIPVEAYYEGYNNLKVTGESVTKGNVDKKSIIVTYSEINIPNGHYICSSDIKGLLSKRNAINAYTDKQNVINDTYEVIWQTVRIKNTNSGHLEFEQTQRDSIGIFFPNCIRNKEIYFAGDIENLLGKDGKIKIYNADTNELIKELNIEEAKNKYTYPDDIKRIKVITSDVVEGKENYGTIQIHNVKEINYLELTNEISIENLLKQEKVYSYGKATADNQVNFVDYADYKSPISNVLLETSKTDFSSQVITNTDIKIKAQNDLEQSWANGIFLIKFPSKVTNVNINSIRTSNSNVIISQSEKYEKDGNVFIKIVTSNNEPLNFDIDMNINIECDPMTITTSENIEIYAYNPNNDIYDINIRKKDIYDINNNNSTSDFVGYGEKTINIIAPNSLLTNEQILDENGKVVARPSGKLEIDKDSLTKRHTVEVKLLNNYSGDGIKNTFIVGKIPTKNNTYIINGKEVGSDFNTYMTNSGIKVPEEIKDKVKIYYSQKDDVTKDINDSNNEWVESPSDFSKIKSYIIDLSALTLKTGDTLSFYYDFEISGDAQYNQISYSTHAVYFNLLTSEGKLAQQIETTRVGVLIAKRLNLDLIKYEEFSNEKVKDSVYSIKDGKNEVTKTTDENGKIRFDNIFLEKEYTLVEKQENLNYEKDPQVIRFNTYLENNELKIKVLEGSLRGLSSALEDGKYVGEIDLDTKAKYILDINKFEYATEKKLSNVKFDIISSDEKMTVVTNVEGNIRVPRLYQDKMYTLRETYAEGYEDLVEDINFKVTSENGVYKLQTLSGVIKQDSNVVKKEGSRPTLTLNIENKKVNSYTFELSKVDKNTEKSIPNTVFSIQGRWIQDGTTYTTNKNGKIRLNLYEGVEYTLKEEKAASGYVLNNDEIKFVANKEDGKWKLKTIKGNFRNDAFIENDKISVEIANESIFTIVKKDEETGKLLKGVKFAINEVTKNEDGTETLNVAKDVNDREVGKKEIINGVEYQILETDKNGTIGEQLKTGLYRVIEVQALEGYDISNIEKYTYYFGIGESSEGKSSISLESQNSNIQENYISKTSDGGYVGVHDGTITKYNKDFDVEWQNSSLNWNDWTYNGYTRGLQKVVQTYDGGYLALSVKSLVKYTSSGSIEWKKENNANDNYSNFADFTISNDGNILLVAYVSSDNDSADYVSVSSKSFVNVQKLNMDSTEIWTKNLYSGYEYNDSHSDVVRVYEDSQNCILVYFSREDGYTQMLYKLDSDGKEIFGRIFDNDTDLNTYGTRFIILLNDVIEVNDGYVFAGMVKGRSAAYGIYEDIDKYNTYGAIIKMNKDGRVDWTKAYNGTPYDIKKTKEGNYIISTLFDVSLYSNDFEKLSEYNPKIEKSYYDIGKSYNWPNTEVLDDNKILFTSGSSILNIAKEASNYPERQEIIVYNSLKEYNISTATDGHGKISGMDTSVFEKVKYGKDSTKDIVVTPDEGYSISKIMVNGDEIEFTPNEDGTVTLPKFTNVTQNKDILAKFVEKSKLGIVDVKYYVNNTTEEICPTLQLRGEIGTSYMTEIKNSINGYSLVTDKLPQNAYGTISTDRTEVIYYYEKLPVKITTYFYDIDTNKKIAQDRVEYKNVNEEYNSLPLAVTSDKYVLASHSDNIKGIITGNEEGNEINIYYYYRTKEFTVKTKCENEGGTITGNGEEYLEKVKYGMNSSKKIIVIPDKNYEIDTISINGNNVEFTSNDNGTVELGQFINVTEDKEVSVKFKKSSSKLIVSYVEEKTGNKLIEDQVINGFAGDEYIVNSKSIPHYKLIATMTETVSGKLEKGQMNIIFYYEKNIGKVVIKYLDINTKEEVSKTEIITKEEGEKYTTNSIKIDGYELVNEPENKNGLVTEKETEVIYYYSKVKEPDESIVPDEPEDPETPVISNETNTPSTGDCIFSVIIILILSIGVLYAITQIKRKRGESFEK